jgi:hypothetical protein
MLPIYWCAFSWEAFATLVTGLAAVAAAFCIGRKQIEITKQQVDIQELAVRSELFDRRYDVFDRTEKFIWSVMREGDFLNDDTARDFVVAKGVSRFLLCQLVSDGLQEIWQQACELNQIQKNMNASYQRDQNFGEGNPDLKLQQNLWFAEKLRTLPTLFEELQLDNRGV